MFLAYPDEFGGIGPYIGSSDLRRYDTPVFGCAGFVLPALSRRLRESPAA